MADAELTNTTSVALPPLQPRSIGSFNPFDPTGLGLLSRIPLLPEKLRQSRHVLVQTDHRFKAAARLLQALWRQDRDLPIGRYTDHAGKVRRLGSLITAAAGERGANFLDPEDLPVINRALIYREIGAVYNLDRLRTNLLSSQPLCFNLFAGLKRDLSLATRVCAILFPGLMAEVTDILFEHSPGRNDPRFTQDGTAFDVAIRGRSPTGERVFVGVEVKYSEAMQEPVPRFTGTYVSLAPRTGLFSAPDDPALWRNPVQQLFRLHCLTAAIPAEGVADRAVFVLLAPQHNHLVWAAAEAYRGHLCKTGQAQVPFLTLSLEQAFAALAEADSPEQARRLHRRYTDFWLVDGELDLTAAQETDRTTDRCDQPRPCVGSGGEADHDRSAAK